VPSRELLVVVLGDYWFRCTAPIPSASLVAVLGQFGVSGANTRAALSRLTREGAFEVTKEGRRTFYRFTSQAAERAATRGRLLMRFGLDWPHWDGRWTCVAFALPEDANRVGPVLRTRMRRLGLSQLYDGFWVSPHDVTRRARSLLDGLGVTCSTVLRTDLADLDTQGRSPADAWNLSALHAAYADFATEIETFLGRLDGGGIEPAEALTARTALTLRWRKFVYDDPRLPLELLPADWPMPAARDRFVALYDGLGPLAEHGAREVAAPFSMSDGDLPRHHRVIDVTWPSADSWSDGAATPNL
jgi:phenylacetic acid degradation operon negative regulatory protein